MSENKQISRKDFLKGVGVTVAGVALTGTLGSVLTGCAAKPTAAVDLSQKPAWPFEYKKVEIGRAHV